MRLPTVVLAVVILGAAGASNAQAAARPDLAASTPSGLPGAADPLEGFAASVVTRNLGRAKARATRIAFFLSKDRRRSAKDLPFATEFRVGKLRAGRRASRRGRLVIPLDASGGRWFVLACVDPSGSLREAKEGNNCAASRRIRVEGPDPLKVGFTLESERAQSETARSVTAVGRDGTLYTFEGSEVDAQALDAVKLTPLAIAPAPSHVLPRGGVLIEPAGIIFDTPATLRIEPPQLPPARGLVGFAASADGSEFHLVPAIINSGAVEVEVSTSGLVGFGTMRGTAPESTNVPAAPAHRLSQAAAVALATGGGIQIATARAAFDADDYRRRACDYYTGGLKPRLQAATTRGKKEVVYALVRETAAMLHNAGKLGIESLDCADGYLDLFEKIIKRVFDEAYKECKTAGGDPFEEGLTMLSMLRQGQLLGFPDNPDLWLGAGAVDKIVECSVLSYDVTYSASYETRTDGGWASTGGVSAPTTRVRLGARDVIASLNVPNPSATFSGDCAGSFVRNDGGSLRLRSSLVVRQRYRAATVNGRYDPHAEVVLEREVRFDFSHSAVAVWRIECGGGPSDWDLAADGSGTVRYPPEGGTRSTVSSSFPEPGSGDDTCVECERSTGTLTVRAAGS